MADLEIDFKFFVEGIFLVRFGYEIYIWSEEIPFPMSRFWSGSEASLAISSALFGSTRRWLIKDEAGLGSVHSKVNCGSGQY